MGEGVEYAAKGTRVQLKDIEHYTDADGNDRIVYPVPGILERDFYHGDKTVLVRVRGDEGKEDIIAEIRRPGFVAFFLGSE